MDTEEEGMETQRDSDSPRPTHKDNQPEDPLIQVLARLNSLKVGSIKLIPWKSNLLSWIR